MSGFEKLWAPWRMKYIEGIDTDDEVVCVFCAAAARDDDRDCRIVYRGERCFGILNIFPYNNGHLLVVPYAHTGELGGLDVDTRRELFDVADMAVEVMKHTMRPDGFNLGMNLGRSAGAGIADHVHLHLVPRWNGDTNFMPVVGGAKVISESLDDTCDKLVRGIADYFGEDDGLIPAHDVRRRLRPPGAEPCAGGG